MALTEQEEFELLSLEREKAMGGGQDVQPPQTEQPQKPIPEISVAPQQNLLQRLSSMFQQTPAESQNIYAVSQATGKPMKEIQEKRMHVNPQVTGMMRDPTATELAGAISAPYVAGSLITNPVQTLGIGGGYALLEKLIPTEKLIPKDASEQTKQTIELADMVVKGLISAGAYKGISSILGKVMPKLGFGQYAKNKVLAIREGAKEYHRTEVEKYGNMLRRLSSNPDETDPTNMLGKMEEIINSKALQGQSGKPLPPSNKVDSALIKSYNRLYAKWAESRTGKVTVGDMMTELQAIKDSAGTFKEPTNLGRIASDIQSEILGAIRQDINVPEFQAGRVRYAEFKNNMEAINKHFGIWQNPNLTERGEKFLQKGLYRSEEAKGITDLITQKTGQSLKRAKISSFRNHLMANQLLRDILVLGGAGTVGFTAGKYMMRKD